MISTGIPQTVKPADRVQTTGRIFNIQRYSIHDGPGIRTLVFFKGCPLRCLWCSNPESQKETPELFFTWRKCIGCGRCIEVCPTGAMKPPDGSSRIDRSLCTNCGMCADICPPHALEIKGKSMTVEEVMKEARKDLRFFQNSGGGVTLGGGDPSMYPDFARELLTACHDEGIHTAVETCGYADWEAMEKIAEQTDLFLYDVKAMDSDLHRRLTGRDNDLILQNAQRISEMGVEMTIRVPLVPGMNDSEENIAAIAEFVRVLPYKTNLELLPYHRLGESKYESLGRPYSLQGLEPIDPDRIAMLRDLVAGIL